jgi:hypothetical protein
MAPHLMWAPHYKMAHLIWTMALSLRMVPLLHDVLFNDDFTLEDGAFDFDDGLFFEDGTAFDDALFNDDFALEDGAFDFDDGPLEGSKSNEE